MPINGDVLAICEQKKGLLQEISLELISEGRKLADKLGRQMSAFVPGSESDDLAQPLIQLGADNVFLLDHSLLYAYHPEVYTDILSDFLKKDRPGVVLIGHTAVGRDLAPRLAARLKCGIVTECTAISYDRNGSLLYTKPIYDGKASCTVTCIRSEIQIVTMKPGAMDIGVFEPSRKARIEKLTPEYHSNPKIKIIGYIKADPKTVNLKEAETIVSGGGGAISNGGWPLIEELAEILDASMAGSRVAVDAGYITSQRQVGQTGKTVKPRLYIACGISGAIQHTIGMKDAELVVAINCDRAAPIFKIADVCIVADLKKIVPAITHHLRKLKAVHFNSKESQ